jgi:hypothetical protein
MTRTGLPAVMLTCRNGHEFMTKARGRTTVRCPECGAPKRVPADRPQTEREARGRADRAVPAEAPATDPAAGSELADRWDREAPWDGRLSMLGGRPGDMCGECDGPLRWEPGRTLTYCPACQRPALPAAVTEHYRRQDQRSAEVAVRAEPNAAAVRAARVRLRALQQRMADRVNEWIDAFDPEELTGGPLRLALDYRAELAAYLPEIKSTASEAELTVILAEITEITERAGTSGTLAEIERQREAVERQAEYAERQAELAEQAEREAREADRRAEIEARAQRRAIEGGSAQRRPVVMPGSQNGYVTGAVMIAQMAESYRRNKERKLNEYGPCGYEHRKPAIPERRYWIATQDWQGNATSYELPGAPAAVVCGKHFKSADAWIQEQAALITRQRGMRVIGVYTELK